MYQLTLWSLIFFSGISFIGGIFGILDIPPASLALHAILLLSSCEISSRILTKLFQGTRSTESSAITAGILFFLLPPPTTTHAALTILCAGILAMTSKYLIARKTQHILNPAAFGAWISGILLGTGATWWIATPKLFPFVLIFGSLVALKIHKQHIAITGTLSALATSTVVMYTYGLFSSFSDVLSFVPTYLTSWPIIFFATFMLTEPSTLPRRKSSEYLYAGFVGILMSLPLHLGSLTMSPELALLLGNILTLLITPATRHTLRLQEVREEAESIFHFTFTTEYPVNFLPGQYAEWTLPHKGTDRRGNRRYFTLAGSPGKKSIELGVKISNNHSSFKEALKNLAVGDRLTLMHIRGEFVLPEDLQKPLVCIAGGIGVTPFHSMISDLIERNISRPITLIYCAKKQEEFAYLDLFRKSSEHHGVTLHLHETETLGPLTEERILSYAPNLKTSEVYVSGPSLMVSTTKKLVKKLGLASSSLHTDYFPGL